jgi:putative colanic acid biosynthesis acetyltransferase WcaF
MRLDAYDNSDFQRGAGSFREVLWWVFRSLLFAPWFPMPSFLKVTALRLFGARVGSGVVIRSRVNVTFPWRLTLGDHVWIGEEVIILSLAPVVIGSHVCISQRAFLCTGSHDHRSPTFDLVTAPITVGEGTWIGASAFVAPGVSLAPGTLCAAGAVVITDTVAGMRVGGNPARELPRSNQP